MFNFLMQSNKVFNMDNIIQAQIQSGIIQQLSENEHNISRFIKDIPDNAPIRSFQRSEVTPYVGSVDAPKDQTYRFRVPRKGYLNRMWLKVRVDSTTMESYAGIPLGILRFGNFFESASLFIGGKRVETLYPESIAYNAMTHQGVCGKNVLQGLAGLEKGGYNVEPGFEFGKSNTVHSGTDYGKDYVIPLEFSIMRFFKDSLDTNFMKNVEVEFRKREILGNDNTKCYVSLVCKHHNVLNHFHTNIRNANHSKESTSKIVTRSIRVVDTPATEYVTVADGTSERKFTFNIPDVGDLTEILISFNKRQEAISGSATGQYTFGHYLTQGFQVVLKSNNNVLVKKSGWELMGEVYDAHSNNIQDKVDPNMAAISFGAPTDIGSIYAPESGEDAKVTGFFLDNVKNPWMYVIPFKLFGTDEFYNGALNTKSLPNLTLEIQSRSFVVDNPSLFEFNIEPLVTLRHQAIARIENKTGEVFV
jgi:hypothetical protein